MKKKYLMVKHSIVLSTYRSFLQAFSTRQKDYRKSDCAQGVSVETCAAIWRRSQQEAHCRLIITESYIFKYSSLLHHIPRSGQFKLSNCSHALKQTMHSEVRIATYTQPHALLEQNRFLLIAEVQEYRQSRSLKCTNTAKAGL
jgi:hypothetical protein